MPETCSWLELKQLNGHFLNYVPVNQFQSRRQTSKRCNSKPDPTNLHQVAGWSAAFTGVETRLWPTVDHLDPPDLPRHGCNSDRGPAASGGLTVLANNHNGGRLRLNVSRHDDDNATPVPADDHQRVVTALILLSSIYDNKWRTTDEDVDVTRRISTLLRCWPTQAVISSREET